MTGTPPLVRVHATGDGLAAEGDTHVSLGGAGLPRGVGTAFVRWAWTGVSLRVEVDRYGMYPVFYEVREGEISVSTSLARLLEVRRPRSLDFDALSVFFRIGFFLDEDTPFRDIRAMPPGGVLEWSAQGLVVRAPPPPRHQTLTIARRDAMGEYQRLFADAIRRCDTPAKTRTVVPLSGGRDSRHILLELCAQDRKPTFCVVARHFPPHPDEDAIVAKEVAELLDVPLRVVPAGPSMFRAEVHKNVATSFCVDEHAWLLELAAFVESEAPDFVFDGIGGDVLSAALFLTPELATAFRTAQAEATAVALLRARPVAQGFGGTALKEVARTRLWNEVRRERALHRLAKAVEPHLHAPNPIASFFFWNRTRREIALSPFALLGKRSAVFTPYLDHDLFDFLSSLPLSMLEDRRFHTDTIDYAYPYARCIRYEDKDAPKSDARAHYLRFARELVRWDLVRRSSPLVRPTARLRLLASAFGPGGAIAGEKVGRMYCYLAQLGRSFPL